MTNRFLSEACGFRFDTRYFDLPEMFYSRCEPLFVEGAKVVALNNELADSMGLEIAGLSESDLGALFSGNLLPQGAEPFAQAYAGHQFGHFTVLGDGRAHVLGEHLMPDGARVDIQFKGSGRTPYSRGGDGRAAVGPMLREYVISEAMHQLGIPTTRSLAVVATGKDVVRETLLPGAILTRVAQSHIRVGTFEFAAATGGKDLVDALLTYSAERHFPGSKKESTVALSFLKSVMHRQVALVVNWMRVGFVHGVMNTDNMTISGETIDYGPCAFMDAYDPATVFSSIDHMGRYAYGNQPSIAQWNLARLAETLLPFLSKDEEKAIQLATETIEQFMVIYHEKWLDMMRSKLGLFGAQAEDSKLVSDLLNWMKASGADYTITFRELSQEMKPSGEQYASEVFDEWYHRWEKRLAKNKKDRSSSMALMRQTNPAVIPRNHKVEEALEAATEGDFKPFHALVDVLSSPYEDGDQLKPYQSPPEPSEQVYQTFCGT